MSQETEYRDSREYSLSRAQELAQQGSVHFDSDRVFRHTSNLSYSHEKVCKCLAQLSEKHFHHAVKYPPKTLWHDVYKIPYIGPTDDIDDLYIKFYITGNCLTLVLCSFHLEGQI